MSDQIAKKQPCSNCGKLADPIHRVSENPSFRGWFCPHCSNHDKPTGREMGLEVAVKP
jgi:hypothetical protein